MPETKSLIDMGAIDLFTYTTLVQAGDDYAIERMITAHMRLAYVVAGKFASRFPHRRDDLRQQAILGLVQAVHWVAEGRPVNKDITTYIIITMYRFIRDFIEHDFTISVPRKAFASGVYLIVSEFNDQDIKDNSFQQEREVEEIIEWICKSTFDKDIIHERMDNYTLQEIGKMHHVTGAAICQRIQKIRETYRERMHIK